MNSKQEEENIIQLRKKLKTDTGELNAEKEKLDKEIQILNVRINETHDKGTIAEVEIKESTRLASIIEKEAEDMVFQIMHDAEVTFEHYNNQCTFVEHEITQLKNNTTYKDDLTSTQNKQVESADDSNNKSIISSDKCSNYSFMLTAYVNAKHYVTFKGKRGQVHAHSWQIQIEAHVNVEKTEQEEFAGIIDQIKKGLATYENKILNEIYPFDRIQPTTENISLYLFNTIEEMLAKMGLYLEKITLWETPTRGIKVTSRYEEFDRLFSSYPEKATDQPNKEENQSIEQMMNEEVTIATEVNNEIQKSSKEQLDTTFKQKIISLLRQSYKLIPLLIVGAIAGLFEIGAKCPVFYSTTWHSTLIVVGLSLWLAVTAFFMRHRIWLLYFIWGAVGFTIILLMILRGSPVEHFMEQQSGIVLQYVLSVLHIVTLDDRGAAGTLTALNKLTNTWTTMGIDIETSGILEMCIFVGMMIFYPGYTVAMRTKYSLIGIMLIYIINITRMATVISVIQLGGGDFLSFGPLVMGRLVYFILTIALYWAFFTKPTLKIIWARVRND